MISGTHISIICAGALVAGAVLHSNGTLDQFLPERPYQVAVKAKLSDPESAQFQNVKSSGNGSKFCGQVNSKNRAGGYSGWKSFIAFDLPEGWNVHFVDGLSISPSQGCG